MPKWSDKDIFKYITEDYEGIREDLWATLKDMQSAIADELDNSGIIYPHTKPTKTPREGKQMSDKLVSLRGKADPGAIEAMYKAKPIAFNAAIFTSVLYVLLVLPYSVVSFFSETVVGTAEDGTPITTTHDIPFLALSTISIPLLLAAYGMFFETWSKHTKRYLITKADHREQFKEWQTRKSNQGQNPKPVWIGAIQTTNDLLEDYGRLLLVHVPGDIHHDTLTAAMQTTLEINEENVQMYHALEPLLDSTDISANDELHLQTDKLIQEVEQLIALRDDSAKLYVRSRADQGHNLKIQMRFEDIKHKLDGLLEAGDLAIVSGSPINDAEREVVEARIAAEREQRSLSQQVSDMRDAGGVSIAGKSDSQVWMFGFAIFEGIRDNGQPALDFDWHAFEGTYDNGKGDLDKCMEMCIKYSTDLPVWQAAEKARKEREEQERKAAKARARQTQMAKANQFITGKPAKR